MLFFWPNAFALCRAQSEGSAPAVQSALRPFTNLNHFYPVAERAQAHKSRSTGFGSEQPEFVARNTATSESVQTKSKRQKSPCLKFLKVLRKLLSRSFLSRAWGRAPRSSPSHVNVFHIFASVIGDELLPRGEVVAEERVEDAIGHSRVGRGDRDQTAGLGIHRRLPHHARLVLA